MLLSLTRFLGSSRRPPNTFTRQELEGFLFALACIAASLQIDDWLKLIFGGQDANYADGKEEIIVREKILTLYHQSRQKIQNGDVKLPRGCRLEKDTLANFEPSSPLSNWSRGFVIGHDFSKYAWKRRLSGGRLDDLYAYVLVLGFFADRQLSEELYRESGNRRQSFEEMAGTVLMLFEPAMKSYADLGVFLLKQLRPDGNGC